MGLTMGRKFYLAMKQVYEAVLDADGKRVLEPRTYQRRDGTTYTCAYVKRKKVEGKFAPIEGIENLGFNGVVSAYDTPAKARRYAGTEGFAMEMDADDGLNVDASIEERFTHCENRLQFWAAEADRLQAEMKKVND